MKHFTKKNRRTLIFYLFALSILSTTIISCKKKETDTGTLSYLRVINASPSTATYNVYLNGNIINTAALPFAGSAAYTTQSAGAYTLKFTSASTTESLFTKSISLSATTYNSFYLINKPAALEGLALSDDLSVPSTDKAYVRFINLSPDAPALDLAKTSATTSLITNKAYKAASGFIAIDAGTYALDAKETSSGAIKTTLSNTTFAAGYHYDVICGGLVTPANDNENPINLRVILIK